MMDLLPWYEELSSFELSNKERELGLPQREIKRRPFVVRGYSTAALRAIRKQNGVGRPPVKERAAS